MHIIGHPHKNEGKKLLPCGPFPEIYYSNCNNNLPNALLLKVLRKAAFIVHSDIDTQKISPL